jgi:hypothetical protein
MYRNRVLISSISARTRDVRHSGNVEEFSIHEPLGSLHQRCSVKFSGFFSLGSLNTQLLDAPTCRAKLKRRRERVKAAQPSTYI